MPREFQVFERSEDGEMKPVLGPRSTAVECRYIIKAFREISTHDLDLGVYRRVSERGWEEVPE